MCHGGSGRRVYVLVRVNEGRLSSRMRDRTRTVVSCELCHRTSGHFGTLLLAPAAYGTQRMLRLNERTVQYVRGYA